MAQKVQKVRTKKRRQGQVGQRQEGYETKIGSWDTLERGVQVGGKDSEEKDS
jgi:hypothetical protein